MTRNNILHKWLVYGLALFPVWLLDIAVLNRYPVLGVHPNLLVLAVVAVATLESPFAGAGFGLGTGLLWYCTYAGISSWQILILAGTGLLVGAVTQYALSQSLWGCLICGAAALATQAAGQLIGHLFLRVAPLESLLQVAIPEFLWTLAWTPAVYLIFYLVYRKVGGTRLAA